jgi:hypothetical protein
MDKCWDGFYTCQKRLSRFPALVDVEKTYYEIDFTGSPAQHYRFNLNAPDTGSMTVKIQYRNAKTYGIWANGGGMVPMNEYNETLKQPGTIKQKYCGENRYLAQKNILEFYITHDCYIEIKPRNVIQAMVRMQWTMESFFSDGGTTSFADRMAGALGIHASSIKVVGVYQGSVILDYEIGTEEESTDDTTASTQTEEQKAAAEKAKLAKLAEIQRK